MSNSRRSAIGVIKEASYGAGGTVNLFLFHESDRFQGAAAYTERRGARKTIGMSTGEIQAYTARGGGIVDVDPDMGAFLFLLMGADSAALVGGSTITYDHTMTLESLKSFVAQRDVGGIHVAKYVGCVITDFTFEIAPDQPLRLDWNCIAKNDADDTVTTPSFSTRKRFNYKDMAAADVLIGGSANPRVISARIRVERNIRPARHMGDGLFISGFNEGQVRVSGDMVLDFDSVTDYKKFMYGGSSNTLPNANPILSSFKTTYTSAENIEAGFPYKLTLECPNIAITAAPATFDNLDDPITLNASFTAYENTIGGKDDFKLVLRNAITTAYV